jgi:hypothetical protein
MINRRLLAGPASAFKRTTKVQARGAVSKTITARSTTALL